MSMSGVQRGVGMLDRSVFRRYSLDQTPVSSTWLSIKTN